MVGSAGRQRHYVPAHVADDHPLATRSSATTSTPARSSIGPAEERAVIDPFFVEGMRRGEKAVYIVDPRAPRRARGAARRAARRRRDLLDVTTWNDAHLKGGSFDQDRMMAALDEMIRDARRHRPAADAAGRSDGLGLLVAAGHRAAGRLRGQRQRGAQPRQDADGLRLRRAPAERLDDDGPAARAPAHRHERRAAREPVLHAGRRDAARAAAAPRARADAWPRRRRAARASGRPTSALHPRPRGAQRAAVDVRRPLARRGARDRARRAADRADCDLVYLRAARRAAAASAPRSAGAPLPRRQLAEIARR